MTILEGKYIDKLLKIIITDVDTVSQIIHSKATHSENAKIQI